MKTTILIPSQNASFEVPGTILTETQVRSMYGGQISGLANMTATSADGVDADGQTRTLTFRERTGNKG